MFKTGTVFTTHCVRPLRCRALCVNLQASDVVNDALCASLRCHALCLNKRNGQ